MVLFIIKKAFFLNDIDLFLVFTAIMCTIIWIYFAGTIFQGAREAARGWFTWVSANRGVRVWGRACWCRLERCGCLFAIVGITGRALDVVSSWPGWTCRWRWSNAYGCYFRVSFGVHGSMVCVREYCLVNGRKSGVLFALVSSLGMINKRGWELCVCVCGNWAPTVGKVKGQVRLWHVWHQLSIKRKLGTAMLQLEIWTLFKHSHPIFWLVEDIS